MGYITRARIYIMGSAFRDEQIRLRVLICRVIERLLG